MVTDKVLPEAMLVFWFKLIPAVAFVVPMFKVVVPDGVSRSGVRKLVTAVPLPEMMKLELA